MEDSLRRDDLRPAPKPIKTTVKRTMWIVMRGAIAEAGIPATRRLYNATQAKRFVRLAKRWGHEVYATRFSKVAVGV